MSAAAKSPTLLLIDDDIELGNMLSEFFSRDDFQVAVARSGEQGLDMLRGDHFDLVILDIMMPGMSGLDVLRHLRPDNPVPVLMLTARGDDIDRIIGLEFGADDYLAKPFNPRELLARVRAILRRAATPTAGGKQLRAGAISLDLDTRRVTSDGERLQLTGTEFEILRCLMMSPGEVVSREQLSETALGRRLLPYDRSIDTHISNLRNKLEKSGNRSDSLQNRRGIGYLLVPGGGKGSP